jgi:thiopeptide-type bacteriocin biosynthesis protein
MTEARSYLPCDEWLYIRIYTGHRTADKILSEILYLLWKKYNKKGLSKTWFFVRYSDPDFHLRFRAKMTGNDGNYKLLDEVKQMFRPLTDAGLVWEIDIGTYMPERERYGTESMPLVEQIFCADSIAVTKSLCSGLFGNDEDNRWLYAIASIDQLLDDFEFNLEDQKSLLLELSRSYGKEFGKNKDLAKQLSDKFRQHRKNITGLLSGDSDHLIHEVLSKRSLLAEEAVKKVLNMYKEGQMSVSKNDLLSSLIHMSMNRIFRNNNRLHEMVVYDLLFRYYKSRMNMNPK